MKRNKVYWIFAVSIVLCCFFNCKKPKGDENKGTATELSYAPSDEIFPNPERGFMHMYSVKSEGDGLDLTQLKALRERNITLMQRIYYFEKFKDQPLSNAELELIQSDMQKVREAGLKCILRFAYTGIDYVYNTNNGEDAPLAVIEQHLDQLKPVFNDNKDIIAFVHAGFIGPWGEWHSSTNGLNTTENERKVLFKLLDVLPAEIMVQIRTPLKKQQIFETSTPVNKDIAYSAERIARVGHHNDCFMSGGNNYGTYDNVEAEKTYISNEALYVPVGGETCPPLGGYDPTCPEGRSEMARLKWSYLNLDWYPPTLDLWRTSGCFDEFQRNLGYRLVLLSSRLNDKATAGQEYKVDITIINRGYAPLYNAKTSSLVLKNKTTGELREIKLAADLRKCKPESNLKIEETIQLAGVAQGSYDLYLKVADPAENLKNRPEYAVRLANKDGWVAEAGMNDLKRGLIIEAE